MLFGPILNELVECDISVLCEPSTGKLKFFQGKRKIWHTLTKKKKTERYGTKGSM